MYVHKQVTVRNSADLPMHFLGGLDMDGVGEVLIQVGTTVSGKLDTT